MVSDGADWARHDERVGGPHVASPAGSPTRSAGDPAEAARREPEWSRLVAEHERMTAKIPTPRSGTEPPRHVRAVVGEQPALLRSLLGTSVTTTKQSRPRSALPTFCGPGFQQIGDHQIFLDLAFRYA